MVQTRSRYTWSTADIALVAALGIAAGVVFWGFNFAYVSINPFLSALLPGCASILHAFWYFSGTLAVLIIRKPGSAVFVNLVGCMAEMILGNSFSFSFVFVSAILQGVFAELPFAVTKYRVFNLLMSVISGACVALEYGVYLMLFRYQGIGWLSPRGIIHMISEILGGILISGILTWYLYVAIAKTGVLDRFASGRAIRQHS